MTGKEDDEEEINGTDWMRIVYMDRRPYWAIQPSLIQGLNATTFVFRVRAQNQFGWSEFSSNSTAMNIRDLLERTAELKHALADNQSVPGELSRYVAQRQSCQRKLK